MSEESIGALWIKKGKKGDFFTGKITVDGLDIPLVCFKNNYKKEGENTPDWRIFLSKPRSEEETPF